MKLLQNEKCFFDGSMTFLILLQTTINMGSLPMSVKSINISNMKKMEVKSRSIASIGNLESIIFKNIDKVILLENSLNRQAQHGPLSMTIEHVNKLEIYSNALSKWKRPHSQINIRNVEECTVDWSAFSPSSEIENVLFENISSLAVDGGAFKANITRLALKNAALDKCCYNAFGGRIEALTLQSLEIKEMKSSCLNAQSWGSLNLTSCHLHHIENGAFQGTISSVTIETTNVGLVESRGFDMSVATLSIRASMFGDLASESLSVVASESIVLQQNNVTTLQTNAFNSLRISQPDKPINVTDLFVGHTEYGAFRFIHDTKVILHGLLIHVHCRCDVRRLALQLVFGTNTTPRDIATEEEPLLLEPLRRSSCTFGSSTLAVREFLRQRCSVEESETVSPARMDADRPSVTDQTSGRRADEASTSEAVNSAAIAVPVILLIVVAAALVAWRRGRAGRGFLCGAKTVPGDVHRTEEDLHVSRTPDAAEEESMYCEVGPSRR